ncbi:MAG: hypothetical protein EOO24_29330 [Comamonadaceae bacterium]|nr:MAG: hypothetical protein EOO24_29330 [Comamonadaceae bacterium]
MNSPRIKHLRWALPLAAALALSACGGGGGGGGGGGFPPIVVGQPPANPPPTDPPVMQSAYDTFVEYMKAIVLTALDTSEPADVTAFDPPPVSDVLEPVATQ